MPITPWASSRFRVDTVSLCAVSMANGDQPPLSLPSVVLVAVKMRVFFLMPFMVVMRKALLLVVDCEKEPTRRIQEQRATNSLDTTFIASETPSIQALVEGVRHSEYSFHDYEEQEGNGNEKRWSLARHVVVDRNRKRVCCDADNLSFFGIFWIMSVLNQPPV